MVLAVPATAPGITAFACRHHAEHGAHPTEARPHGPGHNSSHADNDHHEDSGDHQDDGDHHQDSGGHQDGGQSCTCAGWCPSSSSPTSPASNEGDGRDLVWPGVLRVTAPSDRPLQTRFLPHLLPFANPPPSS